MDKILAKLIDMEKEIAEYKKFSESAILVNTTLIQEIASNIDIKLDILCNLDKDKTSTSKPSVKKNKALSKAAFFKNKLKENINEYVDILYTENEIKELYNHDDVKIKKTEILKKNKVIDLIYINITKNDAQKNTKLKNIYDEYKIDIEKEDAEEDDDEETKNND